MDLIKTSAGDLVKGKLEQRKVNKEEGMDCKRYIGELTISLWALISIFFRILWR